MIFNKKVYLPEIPFSNTTTNLLLLSTFFALLSLASVFDAVLSIFMFCVFLIVAVLARKSFWKPIRRFLLFVALMLALFFQMSEINKELGTALLAAAMIVKFSEIHRKKDLNVMILCNLLAPFVMFLQKQNTFFLFIGGLTIVLSLLALQSAYSQNLFSFRTTLLSFIKWSSVALPVTVLLFVITPRYDNMLWGKSQAKIGVDDNMDVSQWVELFKDYSIVFRVRYLDEKPNANDMYYRGLVLWNFDGKVWSQSGSQKILTVVDHMGDEKDRPVYQYSMSYDQPIERVFSLGFPISKPQNGVLFSNGLIVLANQDRIRTIGLQATSQSIVSPLSVEERKQALQLPSGLNPKTVEQAKRWRKKFKTDEEYIHFIMERFKKEFTYSLSPPKMDGPNFVDSFLFDAKMGFCQHYSSAFAVLMRSVNIPTRIVNGYMGSEYDEINNVYRIRQTDAHAWNEVWMDGRWVRFDPTNQVVSMDNRSNTGWNMFNKRQSLSDWFGNKLGIKFLAFDEASREKSLEKIKEFLFGVSIWFYLLAALLLVIGASILMFLRIARNQNQFLIDQLNLFFERFPQTQNQAQVYWLSRAKMIENKLSPSVYKKLLFVINQADEHLYGDVKHSVWEMVKTLRRIKRQSNDL